jgi:predicted kinase
MRGQAAQSPGPARVVLMCGIAGAGKTTYAKELEAQGYVRLSIDEEVWERFGRYGVDYDPPMYEKHSAEAEAALQQRLIDLIRAGRDVVVDYSFWERSTRDRYKRLVVAAGGRWDIVYLKVSPERLRERLAARRARLDANAAFPITDALLERFMAGFQAPDGEGETVIDTGD